MIGILESSRGSVPPMRVVVRTSREHDGLVFEADGCHGLTLLVSGVRWHGLDRLRVERSDVAYCARYLGGALEVLPL